MRKPQKRDFKYIKKFFGIDQYGTTRDYVNRGKRGKFKGFNFQINNERITNKPNKEFCARAEEYLGEVLEKLQISIEEQANIIRVYFDDGLDDIELINAQNEFYDKYGEYISDFTHQFERESKVGYKNYLAECKREGLCGGEPEITRQNEWEQDPYFETFHEDEDLVKLKLSVRLKYQQCHKAMFFDGQVHT